MRHSSKFEQKNFLSISKNFCKIIAEVIVENAIFAL